ncbi:MAG: hypothetical protein ABEJ75_00085 [Candidatus Nanohaloarchaea archaeon]
MELIDDWIDSARSVLIEPAEHFRSEERRDGFGTRSSSRLQPSWQEES